MSITIFTYSAGRVPIDILGEKGVGCDVYPRPFFFFFSHAPRLVWRVVLLILQRHTLHAPLFYIVLIVSVKDTCNA